LGSDNTNAIAMIYAEALFDATGELGQEEDVRDQLCGLAEMVRSDSEFGCFLSNPAIWHKEKIANLGRIFKGRICDLLMNFLDVLNGRDRLSLLVKINDEYIKLEDRQAGRVKATLVSAIELTGKEQARLAEQIGRSMHKTVALGFEVDRAIIGGMILKVENRILDGSVKGTLKRLAGRIRQQTRGLLPGFEELIVE
jgi:F-type H+-transporting ATPase subunit delta